MGILDMAGECIAAAHPEKKELYETGYRLIETAARYGHEHWRRLEIAGKTAPNTLATIADANQLSYDELPYSARKYNFDMAALLLVNFQTLSKNDFDASARETFTPLSILAAAAHYRYVSKYIQRHGHGEWPHEGVRPQFLPDELQYVDKTIVYAGALALRDNFDDWVSFTGNRERSADVIAAVISEYESINPQL